MDGTVDGTVIGDTFIVARCVLGRDWLSEMMVSGGTIMCCCVGGIGGMPRMLGSLYTE